MVWFLMKLVFRMFVWLVVMAGGFHFLRPLGYADFFFLLGLFLVGFAVIIAFAKREKIRRRKRAKQLKSHQKPRTPEINDYAGDVVGRLMNA